nr:hypothetical protein BaRGS_003173 [Batillaria attramentaria]
MAALGQLIKFLLIFPIACFCTYTVLLSLVRTIIRKGPRAAFSKTARNQPPKCMQDPTLGTHCYIYLEEVRLHYVTTGSEGKPLMVLVHGFPEFWYSWRYQLREFKDSFRVVAIDLRGYGDSDKPTDVSSYDVSKLVDDVKQLISALGYKKCVLVGHDWGGAVSWSFAQTYPDMVDKLIVMSCPSISAYMKNAWSRLGLRQLRRSWQVKFSGKGH